MMRMSPDALSLRGKRGNAARNANCAPEIRSELARAASVKRWQGHPVVQTLSASARGSKGAHFCLRKNGRPVRWFRTLHEAMTACPGVNVDRRAEQAALRAAGHGRYKKFGKRREADNNE